MPNLQLIFGVAGSGKTYTIRKMAEEFSKQSKQVLLVVPEQFVFETERALLEQIGASFTLNIQVLSFSRMAQQCIGNTGRPLLEVGAKQILLSIALREIADSLELYSGQAMRPSFAKTAASTISALKGAGLNAAEMKKLALMTTSDRLKLKLNDMTFITQAYDTLIESKYDDPDNAMMRLANQLAINNPFAGKELILDSFKGFMGTEYKVLSLLMSACCSTTVSLTADRNAFEQASKYGLFSNVVATANHIRLLAVENGIAIEPSIYLNDNYRFKHEDIIYAEKAWRGDATGCIPMPEHIVLTGCTTPFREVNAVAMQILNLVRQENYRFCDMMLIVRNPDSWKGVLDHTLNSYGIPFFWSSRKSLAESPVCKFLSHALACVTDFSTENLLKYIKTYLCGLTEEEVFELENYVFQNPIASKRWLQEWPQPAEILRLRVIQPLTHLRESLEDCDGKGFCKALYEFMLALKIPEQVELLDTFSREPRLEARLTDQRRAYNELIDLLEQLSELTENYGSSISQMVELFTMMTETTTLSEVPQYLDTVQVGGAELIRPGWGIRAVFIIGANDGVFPAVVQEVGPFSRAECKELYRLGSPVMERLEEQLINEKLLAYQALFCSSERIYVNYADTDMAANAIKPSIIVTHLTRMFNGQLQVGREEDIVFLDRLCAVGPAFAITNIQKQERAALYEWMKINGYAQSLQLIKAASSRSYQVTAREGSRLLFGEDVKVSPSRLEQFAKCRFNFFCQYGLGAMEQRMHELDSLQFGSAFHYVLEKLLKIHTADELARLDNKILTDEITSLLAEFSPELFVQLLQQDAKTRFFANRLVQSVLEAIRRICEGLLAGSFVPVAFELIIGKDGIQPIIMEEGGIKASLVGKIDRVDQYIAKDGKRYIRIIDYKTGEVGLSDKKLQYGLNMQLVYYLDTLCRQKQGQFANTLPAGILYLPLKEAKPLMNKNATEFDITKARQKTQKMAGMVLADPEIVNAMEAGGEGIYTPVKLKKDGTINRQGSAAKDIEEFEKLFSQAEGQIQKMAGLLAKGDFWAYPLFFGSHSFDNACQFCPYDAVCLRDSCDPVWGGDSNESSAEGGEEV